MIIEDTYKFLLPFFIFHQQFFQEKNTKLLYLKLNSVGNLSYATYLVHIPLMMVIGKYYHIQVIGVLICKIEYWLVPSFIISFNF